MFNNPFDSFHNTVAEAKEEREQLDQLLTISTPRERLIVFLILIVLLVLGAWLVLGNVADEVTVDGVVANTIEDSTEANQFFSVVVWVDRDDAKDIRNGLPILVRVAVTEGGVESIRGEIGSTINVPVDFLSGSVLAKRIEFATEGEVNSASVAGKDCRVTIELGRQSPLALFGSRLL